MSRGIVVWRKGYLHVGWRRLDWTDVWYRPIENGTFDQEFDIGLYTSAMQGERHVEDNFRQPKEAEMAWRPHFDPSFCEARTLPSRRDLQRQLLTDVHQYINGDVDAQKVRQFERYAVDGRNIKMKMVFAEAVKVRAGLEKIAKKKKARANANNIRDDDDSAYSSTDSSDSDNDGPATQANGKTTLPQGQKKKTQNLRRQRGYASKDDRPRKKHRTDQGMNENDVYMSGAIVATPDPTTTNYAGIAEDYITGHTSREVSLSPMAFTMPIIPSGSPISSQSQREVREGSNLFISDSIEDHRDETPVRHSSHRPSPIQRPDPPRFTSPNSNGSSTHREPRGTLGTLDNLSKHQSYVEDEDEDEEIRQLDKVIMNSLVSANQIRSERTTREASLAHIQPDDMDEDAALAEATRRSLAPDGGSETWSFSNLSQNVAASGGRSARGTPKSSGGTEDKEGEEPS